MDGIVHPITAGALLSVREVALSPFRASRSTGAFHSMANRREILQDSEVRWGPLLNSGARSCSTFDLSLGFGILADERDQTGERLLGMATLIGLAMMASEYPCTQTYLRVLIGEATILNVEA